MRLIEETKGGTLGLFKQKLYVLPLILGAIVAFFTSENVFAEYPIATNYFSFVSHWMPLIENHAQYSAFPNATRLYLSIVWVLLPLQVIATTRWLHAQNNDELFIKKFQSNDIKALGLTPKQFAPLLIILLYLVVPSFFLLGKDPSFCKGCVNNNNKVGMVFLWSLGLPIAIGFLLTFQIKYFRNFKKIYF
jgi:hypothetical protein